MKKLICALLAISSSLSFSNIALAKDADVSVTTQTAANTQNASTIPVYGTDIVITNYSAYDIYVRVPALNMGFWVNYHSAQHIHGYDNVNKQVILSDYNGNVFYNAITPNYYPIDVYDNQGHSYARKNK